MLHQDGVLATLILDAATPPSFRPAPLAGWIGDRDGQRSQLGAHLVSDTPPSGGPQLTLSAARPNPFNPRTSFQLSLGRSGLARMIERNCAQARRFAAGFEAAGFEILNEVVLNQVVVRLGEPERTRKVIEAIQADGTCWAGITVWQGHTALRISVTSWATRDEDVERSLEAMIRCARG